MSRRIGDRWGEAAALNNLGNVLLAQADYRQARALYAESLAIKRDLGHQEGGAASLDNLGRAAYGLEEWGEARPFAARSATRGGSPIHSPAWGTSPWPWETRPLPKKPIGRVCRRRWTSGCRCSSRRLWSDGRSWRGGGTRPSGRWRSWRSSRAGEPRTRSHKPKPTQSAKN